MSNSSLEQRIDQRNRLMTAGRVFVSIGFPIFILALIPFFIGNSSGQVEEFLYLGMGSFYGGVLLMALSRIIGWSDSPFWDFIFNRLGAMLVIVGFIFTVFMSLTEGNNGFAWGLIVTYAGFALVGLGRRFHSTPIVDSEAVNKKPKTWKNWVDLQNPQVMRSVVGALVFGVYGILFAVFFKQPVILVVALLIGLLKGIDKQQNTIWANLKLVFKGTVFITILACFVGGLIGALFVGLLFGANSAAFATGIMFGIFAGLVMGAFASLM